MKILYLCNNFPPEVGAGPHVDFQFGQLLAQAGHEVTVVTGFPRYNVPVLPPQYRRKMLVEETMGGMRVLRVYVPNLYGRSLYSRGLVQFVTPPLVALRALFLRGFEMVLTATPSNTMGMAAHWLARRAKVPCVVRVMDLFPQNAIDLGILRNRMLIRFFQAMERYVFHRATAILVFSELNRQYVASRGAAAENVFVVPEYVDTETIRPGPRQNAFRQACGLDDQFVVLYAGTMGLAQGLHVVIEAARLLSDRRDIVFLLVGNGVEEQSLRKEAEGMPNVRFQPMQPKETYPKVLAAADLCLTPLRRGYAGTGYPSKTVSIMAAGRPVVAGVPPGDAAQLVLDAQSGVVVPPGDAMELARAIGELAASPDRCAQFGANGRRYVESFLSTAICRSHASGLLEQIALSWKASRTQ
jgi:colanic acid biosynthesis glycosyl transferase WcaI